MATNRIESVEHLLDSLTEAQRQAAEWKEGPLLVLAGPGSGKTRVLTSRIANLLLDSKEQKFRILALTFTNRAADEMRLRLREIASDVDDRMFIGTFHSFCVDFLRKNAKFAGLNGSFTIYSSFEDRLELVTEAIREHLSPEERSGEDAKKALTAIDYCKSRLISPEECGSKFKDEKRGSLFKKIYKGYEDALTKYNALDFNSLIYFTIKIIKQRPFLAKRIRQTYKYWCLDEFQDTNNGQYELIESIASDSFNNIFVVADDDQIIYQWNGASYQRLEEFSARFKPELLQLPTNFRCPPTIVELANRLVRHNSFRSSGKQPLEAGKSAENSHERVRLLEFHDDTEEAHGVIKDIAERFSKPDGVVVLARNRSILEKILGASKESNIDCRIVQRRDDFQSIIFGWLVLCLKQSVARGDERVLKKLVPCFESIFSTGVTVEDVKLRADSSHGDYFRGWIEEIESKGLSDGVADLVAHVKQNLLVGTSYNRFCKEVISWLEEKFINNPHFDNESKIELIDDLAAWNALWREIHSGVGSSAQLDVFLQELDLRSKEAPITPGTVSLMTIHASKGNEFSHVYLCGLAEDLLPSFQSKKMGDDSPQLEEERRNCFVAITRTEETLTCSYAQRYNGWKKAPSRFLREMEIL